MRLTTTNHVLLGMLFLGLPSLAYAQRTAADQPKLPPIYLFEKLPPQSPHIYPDSVLQNPSRFALLGEESQTKVQRLLSTENLSRYSSRVTASLPTIPEELSTLTTSENVAEVITDETARQGQQLLTAHDQPDITSLVTNPGSFKQSVRDSAASLLNRQSLVSDSVARFVKNINISDLSPDQLDALVDDPLATHRQKALSSADELNTLTTSPADLLRGEVMPDTLVTALRQKIADAPIQDAPVVKQAQSRPEFKRLLIKERTSLLDRSYVEATLGIAPQATELIQFVPTVGTYLTRHLSLGVGLDGLVDGFQNGRAIVGLKTLAKIDILPQRLYLQAENTSYFSDLSYLYEEAETQRKNIQVPYIGAGVLLDILENKGLNFSLMHRLGDHPFFEEGNANWIVRLGMSFYRQSKLR